MLEEDSKVYKLFISHLNQNDEEYELFLTKLNASYDFKWKDYATFKGTHTGEISKQMRPADVVIILSGLISKDENLLNQQIDAAVKLKKPIVVIRPYGLENVPLRLEKIAAEVVGWNTPCIVDAIYSAVDEN